MVEIDNVTKLDEPVAIVDPLGDPDDFVSLEHLLSEINFTGVYPARGWLNGVEVQWSQIRRRSLARVEAVHRWLHSTRRTLKIK